MLREALIFDVDGTIAETEEWHRRAFNETFQAFSLDWDWDPVLYRHLLKVAGGKERIRHYVEAYAPPNGAMALAKLSALHADKTARYAEALVKGEVSARPGVKRLALQAQKDGLRLAVATTTTLSNAEALLKALFGGHARQLFSVIAAGDIVPRKKPAPDIYLYACERLGLSPSACVAIEDSENGVAAARDAGLAVIATPSFYSSEDDFSGATVVLSDLGEPEVPYRFIAGVPIGQGHVDVASLHELPKPAVIDARLL
jgi:HAD superfamily hydrolase (TIGR01509 family)